MNPSSSLDDRWWLRFEHSVQDSFPSSRCSEDGKFSTAENMQTDHNNTSSEFRLPDYDYADDILSSNFSYNMDSDLYDSVDQEISRASKNDLNIEPVRKSCTGSLENNNCESLSVDSAEEQLQKKNKLNDEIGFESSINSYLNTMNMKPYEKSGIEWRKADEKELASLLKSSTHLQNCDLPPPQNTLFGSALTNLSASKEIDVPNSKGMEYLSHYKSVPSYNEGKFNSSWSTGQKYSVSPHLEASCVPVVNKQWSNLADSQSKSFRMKEDSETSEVDETKRSDVLDALRHSQTRAREAEKIAAMAVSDREKLMSLFLKEASCHFVYRQWLRLLEIEIMDLRLQLKTHDIKDQDLYKKSENKPVEHITEKICQATQGQKKTQKKIDPVRSFNWGVAVTLGIGLAGAGLFLGWSMRLAFP